MTRLPVDTTMRDPGYGNRYPTERFEVIDRPIVNPYEPSATQADAFFASAPMRPSKVALIAFLPGTVLGLHVGAAVEVGIPAAIQRTTGNPVSSAKFFIVFSIVALALTFAYRIPRWLIAGRHRVLWWSAFLSGAVMVGLGFSTVVILGQLGFYNPVGPPSAAAIAVIVSVVLACIVLGVEFEVLMSRCRRSSSGG